nr:hypothetical protein CFP56_70528 [Quercus suber]
MRHTDDWWSTAHSAPNNGAARKWRRGGPASLPGYLLTIEEKPWCGESVIWRMLDFGLAGLLSWQDLPRSKSFGTSVRSAYIHTQDVLRPISMRLLLSRSEDWNASGHVCREQGLSCFIIGSSAQGLHIQRPRAEDDPVLIHDARGVHKGRERVTFTYTVTVVSIVANRAPVIMLCGL